MCTPITHLHPSCSLQVIDGKLAPYLSKVIKFASSHVFSCSLCRAKGFFCELCHNGQVLYPFQESSIKRYRFSQIFPICSIPYSIKEVFRVIIFGIWRTDEPVCSECWLLLQNFICCLIMTQAGVTMRQSVLRDHPPPMDNMTHSHAGISETRLQQSSLEIRGGGLELSDTGSGIHVITHWHTDAFARSLMTPILSVVLTEDEPNAVDCSSARKWGIIVMSVNVKRSTVLDLRLSLLLLPTAAHLLWVRFWVLTLMTTGNGGQPAVFAGAVDAALCSMPSVGRKLSRVLAAFTGNSTTRGRRPSGQLMTTAFTCRTKTPEDTQTRCKRKRQVAMLDKVPD